VKINIYEKLQKCRVELQESNVKKSGHNKFAGYTYYELGDFLPTINKICLENKIFCSVSFGSEMAILEAVNAEKPEERVLFTSPMSEANLKGCHPIQNLGAVETYQRRYLYSTAFEIVEHDALDSTNGSEKPSEPRQDVQNQNKGTDKGVISEAQARRFFAISGGNADLVRKIITKHGYKETKEIPRGEKYNAICKEIEEGKHV